MQKVQAGEIYWVDLPDTQGKEQQKHRPVLVVSPEKFNSIALVALIVPITSKGNFAKLRGFTVEITNCETKGVARIDQLRVLDLKARKAKKIGKVSDEILEEVLAKLRAILD